MDWTSYACFEGQKHGVLNTATKTIAMGAARRSSQWVQLESFELRKPKGVEKQFPLVITQEFGPASAWLQRAARDEDVLSADVRAHTGNAAAAGRVLHDFSFTFQAMTISTAVS